jgi:GAF domain-containing protein
MDEHLAQTDRELWLADTLVELGDSLVSDFDVIELLSVLATRCAMLLDASEVGVLLRNELGGLTVMASTSERARALELFEIQSEEGPCLDCVTSSRQVAITDLDGEGRSRWPRFAEEALAVGYSAVVAMPMRLREETIGAVNVFLDGERAPGPVDLRLAQAFADAATISILQDRVLDSAQVLADQMQHALHSRIALEQAKGIVAEVLVVSMDEAFDVLRGHARANTLKLSELSRRLVEREIRPTELRRPKAD